MWKGCGVGMPASLQRQSQVGRRPPRSGERTLGPRRASAADVPAQRASPLVKIFRRSSQFHKWLSLVVGVQMLFWVGGGLVMTLLPIEKVRSEHRVAEATATALDPGGLMGAAEAARAAGVAAFSKAEIRTTRRGPVWTLTPVEGEPVTVSAVDGRALAPLDGREARRLAALAYSGPGTPVAAAFLPEAPEETGRKGALWRVDFDDAERTSFYLSPETGEVLTRRSELWRFFDLMWRLHAMDWDDGEDFNHPLIVVTAAAATIVVLSGFVLLWFRMRPARRRRRTGDREA